MKQNVMGCFCCCQARLQVLGTIALAKKPCLHETKSFIITFAGFKHIAEHIYVDDRVREIKKNPYHWYCFENPSMSPVAAMLPMLVWKWSSARSPNLQRWNGTVTDMLPTYIQIPILIYGLLCNVALYARSRKTIIWIFIVLMASR